MAISAIPIRRIPEMELSTMRKDMYQDVTNRILAELESGTAPWVKSWTDIGPESDLSMPHNAVSRKAYRGINVLLLWLAKQKGGFNSSTWLTYKQAQALGGHVRKGSKGTSIVFFKPVEKTTRDKVTGEESKESYAVIKGYTVFNADQCENIGEPIPKPAPRGPVDGSLMLDVAREIKAQVRIEGNKACFIPSADVVLMPHVDQFHGPQHFEATLAHELVHWTGHKSRLHRTEFTGRFGSESYAVEELVAEMGAAFLSAEMGFCLRELQHASYLQSWIKVLQNDKRALFRAAAQAQKAVEYVKERLIQEPVGEAA